VPSRVPRWLRVVIPAVLILVWLTAASIGGPNFGRVDEVSSNDQTTYLPSSADATRVQKLASGFTDSDASLAIVLYTRDSGLTSENLAEIDAQRDHFAEIDGVAGDSSPAVLSDDGASIMRCPRASGHGSSASSPGGPARSGSSRPSCCSPPRRECSS
jgi:RND superfamily putative drug exporter